MKRTWLRSATFTVALALAAAPVAYAQGGQKPTGTQSQGQGTKTAPTQQASGGADQVFVKEMFMTNMAEIELGKMAAEKASSADVKSYAQMMVTQHTQANKDLIAVASGLSVEQPTALDAKHQALSDRLSKLSGAEFDRQYMQAMVAGHRETVAKIKPKAGAAGKSASTATTGTTGTGASGSGTTAGESVKTVPQYAAKTLPVVQKHLQEAERLQKSVK
jgi:putative membrane protein